MEAKVKRTLSAALRAAKSLNTASDKLASSTADFIAAAGGFDQAIKVLNAQRGEGRTWKDERADNSPLWRVYNAVSAAKSRAKQGQQQQQGRAGRAGQQAGKAGEQAGKAGEQAGKAGTPATKPATPAQIMGVVLSWTPEQIAKAIREQTAVLEASAVDTLTDVLGLLLNKPTPTPTAPRKAPAKRAPAKRK